MPIALTKCTFYTLFPPIYSNAAPVVVCFCICQCHSYSLPLNHSSFDYFSCPLLSSQGKKSTLDSCLLPRHPIPSSLPSSSLSSQTLSHYLEGNASSSVLLQAIGHGDAATHCCCTVSSGFMQWRRQDHKAPWAAWGELWAVLRLHWGGWKGKQGTLLLLCGGRDWSCHQASCAVAQWRWVSCMAVFHIWIPSLTNFLP
jgi:hypothetical protein